MKRRTLIKQFGTAALATTTLVGAGAAKRPAFDLDREIDVSNVAGTVPLSTVLEPEDIDALPAEVDPAVVRITIPEQADVIDPGIDACNYMPLCCKDIDCPRSCNGCYCYYCGD